MKLAWLFLFALLAKTNPQYPHPLNRIAFPAAPAPSYPWQQHFHRDVNVLWPGGWRRHPHPDGAKPTWHQPLPDYASPNFRFFWRDYLMNPMPTEHYPARVQFPQSPTLSFRRKNTQDQDDDDETDSQPVDVMPRSRPRISFVDVSKQKTDERFLISSTYNQQVVLITSTSGFKPFFVHKTSYGIVVTSTIAITTNIYCLPSDNFAAGSTTACVPSARRRDDDIREDRAQARLGHEEKSITPSMVHNHFEPTVLATPYDSVADLRTARAAQRPWISSSQIEDFSMDDSDTAKLGEERFLFKLNYKTVTTLTTYSFTTTTLTVRLCLFSRITLVFQGFRLLCLPCNYIVCPSSFPSCA